LTLFFFSPQLFTEKKEFLACAIIFKLSNLATFSLPTIWKTWVFL